jgi:hypothetical protein
MASKRHLWIGAMVTLALAASYAQAGSVSLAWSPVQGAAGYRIYYGLSSGNYGTPMDVGSATEATLSNLLDCTAYYIAVKAYNGAGESAGFSNEVTGWARPVVTATTPSAKMQGGEAAVVIQGLNFKPGASVSIDNPRVALGPATVVGCDRIQIDLEIAPATAGLRAAQVGRYTIDVVNPDGTFGKRTQGFEVLANPARFDVNQSDATTRGRIDGRDTVWLARLFGSQENLDVLYDPDFDLDGNGWVDGGDLAYLASNLGRCWSGTTWTVEACATN